MHPGPHALREKLVISCEHGGNDVPPAYAAVFRDHDALLHTHRGWDPGALELARQMSDALDAPLFYATTTRLLMDLNRSIGHKALHSEATRSLPLAVRREMATLHYHPHRNAVESAIAAQVDAGLRVVHVASHSFTPELNGEVRQADVAFLYDSKRPAEREFALEVQTALAKLRPDLRLRRNYPYNGGDDGLTALLRKRHGADRYIGMELEVNQRFVLAGGAAWKALRSAITQAFSNVMSARAMAA